MARPACGGWVPRYTDNHPPAGAGIREGPKGAGADFIASPPQVACHSSHLKLHGEWLVGLRRACGAFSILKTRAAKRRHSVEGPANVLKIQPRWGVAKASRWRTHFHSAPDPSVIRLESARNPPPLDVSLLSRGHQDLLPRDGRKKARPESDPEAQADTRSRGRVERPGTSEASDGGETHRDRPGERGRGRLWPTASYLLSCVPPISPTQRTRSRVGTRGGGESGPGCERKRARADLRVCEPRPATKKRRERRRRESPGKKRNPLQQILGGGPVSPVFSPASPLPGRKAEAQGRDVEIGPDRGSGSEGRVPSPR
ncbi:hypothetical protein NDU88_002273 [Pleurodeles waltl]|uniref:Uncharacterized protein n=1 Tax=Pleurodeles waltl TaxID=8319 RepID=A0AAV7KT27_PLEWA|nr:hypothetical protein NDU88_002273 [Pleurodeles waltl]